MVAISVSRTFPILAVLVACLLTAAALVCLVHTDALDDMQAPHQGHHHSSSAHITLDLSCIVAILPTVSTLLTLYLGALFLSVLLSHPVVPASPPFIPPKALARP
jgi:hypothetical protein